uniref:Uncharacterized protein n=1 Tax=Thermorudis peleae TaxID=1382356 RepID=A0A831TF88_9BACT
MGERWEPPRRALIEAAERRRRSRPRLSAAGLGEGLGMAAGRWLAGITCTAAAVAYARGPLAFALTALLVALVVGGLASRWALPARWRATWLADAWTLGLITPLATVNAYVATQDRALTGVEASLYFETALALCAAIIGLLLLGRRLARGDTALRAYVLLPAALQAAVLLPSARQGDPRSLLVALGGMYLAAGTMTTLGWALPGKARGWLALAGLLLYLGLVGIVTGGLASLFSRPSPVPLVHLLISLAGVLMLAVEGPIEANPPRRAARLGTSTRRPSAPGHRRAEPPEQP